MTIVPVPFVHYVIDLSIKEIVTAKGEKVTLCQIEANAPLDYHGKELGDFYNWGRVLEVKHPLEIVCGCFVVLLLKDCWGDVGIIAVSHTVPEEPTFQALIYEGDDLVVAKSSNLSVKSEANFDFVWFNADQKLRIETIPDFETFDKFRQIKWATLKEREKKEKKEGEADDE